MRFAADHAELTAGFPGARATVHSSCPTTGSSDAALHVEHEASEMRGNDFEYTCDRRRRNRQLISI